MHKKFYARDSQKVNLLVSINSYVASQLHLAIHKIKQKFKYHIVYGGSGVTPGTPNQCCCSFWLFAIIINWSQQGKLEAYTTKQLLCTVPWLLLCHVIGVILTWNFSQAMIM